MHRLYGESDLRTVVVWKNIYACIENCMDVCEHAADIVNTVIMKNSCDEIPAKIIVNRNIYEIFSD